jgi:uncharacterized protein
MKIQPFVINKKLKLISSPFIRILHNKENKNSFVYHTIFGNPRIFNQEALYFLNMFENGLTIEEINAKTDGNTENVIESLMKINFLIPLEFDERTLLKNKRASYLKSFKEKQTVEHISLSVSNKCNFGCRHCFLHVDSKHPSSRKQKMDWEIAKKCIDLYINLLKGRGVSHARIHFGNAEPLTNWPIIEKILLYCESIKQISFSFAINTNLYLLNEKMARTLKKYNVGIVTSLDGLQTANDAIRVTKMGRGTYSRIIKKMTLLENIDYPLETISVVLTQNNYDLVDVDIIDFAYEKRMSSVSLDLDLVKLLTTPLDERVDKLMRIKSYANKKGIYFGGTWFSPFRNLMSSSIDNRQMLAACDAVEGKMLVFEPNGAIKICGYTETVVGHIKQFDELFCESSRFFKFISERLPGSDNVECIGCKIEGLCSGQCHVTREAVDRNQSNILFKNMCNFYKSITDALVKDYLSSYDDLNLRKEKEQYI